MLDWPVSGKPGVTLRRSGGICPSMEAFPTWGHFFHGLHFPRLAINIQPSNQSNVRFLVHVHHNHSLPRSDDKEMEVPL